MKRLRILFIASFLIIISVKSFSIDRNAVGVRLSNVFGITYKYYYTGNTILEGIVELPNNALILNGLYEKYNKIEGIKGLNWFYGGGVYIGMNTINIGIKGAIGLNYQFIDIPLEISLDWMPGIQVISSIQTHANSAGLSIRYKF